LWVLFSYVSLVFKLRYSIDSSHRIATLACRQAGTFVFSLINKGDPARSQCSGGYHFYVLSFMQVLPQCQDSNIILIMLQWIVLEGSHLRCMLDALMRVSWIIQQNISSSHALWCLKEHFFITFKQRKRLKGSSLWKWHRLTFLYKRIHIWPFGNKFCSSHVRVL
jgi:hypothetical protein